MQLLPHGYTNHTLGDGSVVVKHYQGPGARVRAGREQAVLRALRGQIPVPAVLDSAQASLTLSFMAGQQGQELLAAGHGASVLRACGGMLRRIHQLDAGQAAAALGSVMAPGQVLTHGDYGPQNVLLDPATLAVTAVLDWEWARAGVPVADLAWCEWIVRMHHPGEAGLLGAFFAGYGGAIPGWPDRHAAMLGQCQAMLDRCRQWEPGGPGEAQWAHRLAVTRTWHE
ncbi:MAG TPA: aminoglycoside phosphotransferase family protein [Streptosporangiaceae bacterium]|jgi:aminoglycoside phosphotransferase